MSIEEEIKQAIETLIPNSKAKVQGGGGHFQLEVTSPEFAGKRILAQQRMVYSALTNLMGGSNAPVHAIDHLKTIVPESD